MRAIIIDNETTIADHIARVFEEVSEFKLLGNYSDPRQAFNEIMEDIPDVVFIEEKLSEVNEIELDKEKKKKYKIISIVLK